ncbi:hypothetical protein CBER1_09329 [Cercospora berteroae]|uniref:Uncharacterized protein n=1 Tax=Cercospora berteroae TaxID=357750 RepID=A0A2S6CNF3_9PEZI|nr:hypothetical protein CBER1_09329 [Cercospora berteroae]
MATTFEEQKTAICEIIKAEISGAVRPRLRSTKEFWTIISNTARAPPYNMWLSSYKCRGLCETCRKAKVPLPDVRRYISAAVKRSNRREKVIQREQAQLAESEGKGKAKKAVLAGSEEDAEAENSGGDSDTEDLETEKGGDDESEEPRAAQMTLAVRSK